ncbi:Helix-turn-helix domain-containing protein [Nocardia amikacinitolerans]|uniref:Helix-turn-helix domain-containing protein n=1 Tax=Nocardia amikacinitolerans TaxID=756689 RepID=A0A285LKX8_9NOCA|nr:helix-turn-helix domain-containing protein [Nocardia amikacinitolerans]SNY84326.1 Helix-turn-helix domain-containing protein [Nocardia amikacinitolerans]
MHPTLTRPRRTIAARFTEPPSRTQRPRIRYGKAEAAALLAISPRQLDRLRERGEIIARVDGGRVFFDHDELESYAKTRPVEAA